MTCLKMQLNFGNCVSLHNYTIMVTNSGPDNNLLKTQAAWWNEILANTKLSLKRLQLDNGFTI